MNLLDRTLGRVILRDRIEKTAERLGIDPPPAMSEDAKARLRFRIAGPYETEEESNDAS